MFTYFTDRDGKYQLKSLAESAFDPLSRTCRFMLTEEAYHMSVGLNGILRVVQRTVEVMREIGSDDPAAVRAAGAVDLPTIQRYMNFWFSSSLDLFGAEVSSNAAATFATGIKGRADESRYADHDASTQTLALEQPGADGAIREEAVPMRSALNEVLRRSYIEDCGVGVRRWNRIVGKAGFGFELRLPSPRFNRTIGVWAGKGFAPDGGALAGDALQRRRADWLPGESDRSFVKSLMRRVVEPGKVAGWIAPPERGVNNLAPDYEYVLL
jgi:benzoyl-CoA 2,3-dioxygenase component B